MRHSLLGRLLLLVSTNGAAVPDMDGVRMLHTMLTAVQITLGNVRYVVFPFYDIYRISTFDRASCNINDVRFRTEG